MDLIDALRSTGSVREFTDEPIADAVLGRILDTARFAPSGANAQAWRLVVVKDPAIRARLRDLYRQPWVDYLTLTAAGLRPWSPVNDPAAEAAALAAGAGQAEEAASSGLAPHLDEVPVLLALFADLSQLAAVDRDLDRYSLAGGASVYPFAWSILLAARAEGLGGVLTTMLVREEDQVKRLLGAQDPLVLAAVIALGHPAHQVRRLTRQPVTSFATVDRLDGAPFPAASSD
ncbi:nitroreductase family protein [Mycolicibacterium sp. P1-5]|uniref:nitroreductase family protein n=1 Tax=Mycolicibacterium sp. P1-5 TaxID=2024617 RepID=UPI0011ECA3BD|nr:nitroreductase family protein [Mycolicibacterium sp. P1-5]KAA0112011.1 NADH dehydrogenase FAD-containing subunit [Mycolicibacterium sp. P1-5]